MSPLPTSAMISGVFLRKKEGAVVKSYVPSTIKLSAVTSPYDVSNPVYPLGNCYNSDCKTIVVCNGTFLGGYESSDYDHRYRPWHIKTKEIQRSVLMEPLPFYTMVMGITYATPIHDIEDWKKVFAGFLNVDYKCKCCFFELISVTLLIYKK